MTKKNYGELHLSDLSHGWFPESEGRILPTINRYRIGAVAVVFKHYEEALSSLNDEFVFERYGNSIQFVKVGNPWEFMRRAAGEGLCGFQFFENLEPSYRFMFMVRVEEAGSLLPTVLSCIDRNSQWMSSLTRFQEIQLNHAELIHWERFDILDPVSASFGKICPFRDWEKGDLLYELRSENDIVLLGHVPLLGDWNSTEGAVPFFTCENDAYHFLTHYLGYGHNRILNNEQNTPDLPQFILNIRPTPISDLALRLKELSHISPLAAWCINPNGHRENSGYGRLFEYDENYPSWEEKEIGQYTPLLRCVSGIWKILEGNNFEYKEPINAWTGFDTILWSKGQSLQLLPLDRSFTLNHFQEIEELHNLTETEQKEYLDREFNSYTLEYFYSDAYLNKTESNLSDCFFMDCWDSVTGNHFNLCFNHVLDAVCYLILYEKEYDRICRTTGSAGFGYVGFPGSNNSNFEDSRSQKFQLGLRNIALRLLKEGYCPKDANDIVSLCNGTLKTLHVDFAGYAKDLLWASTNEEQQQEILTKLEIDEDDFNTWYTSKEVYIDITGKRLVIERIGETVWNKLLPESQQFLATALVHFEQQGSAPQLDYAPISMEITKALEVELMRIVKAFQDRIKETIADWNIKIIKKDLTDEEKQKLKKEENTVNSFAEFIQNQQKLKKLTIGSMPYLLKKVQLIDSQLMNEWYKYLDTIPSGQYLISPTFRKKALSKVIHRFRNGGVHDSPIREQVCRECIDSILGDKSSPGYLTRILEG